MTTYEVTLVEERKYVYVVTTDSSVEATTDALWCFNHEIQWQKDMRCKESVLVDWHEKEINND
jgi:hypothetical protein